MVIAITEQYIKGCILKMEYNHYTNDWSRIIKEETCEKLLKQ